MRQRRARLLSLSGVRIQDPKLRALGMTLPGFVERGRVIASLPSLGLLTLAAHTPEHWEVSYEEVEAEVDVRDHPDLVAISALSPRVREAYRLADRLRAEGVCVVFGGLHATARPEEALDHFDAVVVGEGESAWPELLADFEGGRLRRIYRSRFDLRRSRVPRYDLLDIERYNRIPLQSTRGCPLDCDFCGASRILAPFKTKPIDRVRAEIEAILDRWPRPFLELADDNTFANKRWARDLLELLSKYPIRWFTETDVSIADDPGLLDLLAGSGCAQVLIGLESVRGEALASIDSRGWKESQRDRYLEQIRRIQSAGVSVNGCFILGFDGDDPGIFDRTLEFVRESALAEVQVTLLTPFPGTRLYDRLLAEERLPDPAPWDRCTLFDVAFEPKPMTAGELADGFRSLVGRLYAPEEVERRRRVFRSCVRSAHERADR